MGLFDFLKPKNDVAAQLAEWEKRPEVQKAKLAVKKEYIQKQVANLRAVGRQADAGEAARAFLSELFDQWTGEPENPAHLTSFTNNALIFNELEFGKEMLKVVIEKTQKHAFSLDLTTVYLDLGRIYHQLRANGDKELWCYHMATEAPPPAGCKFPASNAQKAKAHLFALSSAQVAGNQEHIKWHEYKFKEMAPGIDADNPEEIIKFLQETT